MRNLKLTVATILMAAAMRAETVWFAPNGKTFHASEQCMTLARSKTKLHADKAEAEKHGLKPCGICNRAKKAPKADKNSWAVTK